MKKVLITLCIVLLLFSIIYAQEIKKYERKSISYINKLWLATENAKKVKPEVVSYILERIKREIELARFDYNPLPDEVIDEFAIKANRAGDLDIAKIGKLLDETVSPYIYKILNALKEMRAKALVTEEQKNSFITQKAKEIGITAEQLEKIMNSAYMYVPILTYYEEEKGSKIKVNIKGGIIWYHLVVPKEGETRVDKLVEKMTKSSGFANESGKYIGYDTPFDFAYKTAVNNYARNIKVATQKIPEFRLQAPIAEVVDSEVSFELGKKEGIHLDNIFRIGEFIEDEKGNVEFEKAGWVRTKKVADNRKEENEHALSNAVAVKKGDWITGMTVIEHPQLGIDIALKPKLYQIKIDKGYLPTDITGVGNLEIKDDFEDFAYGIDIDAQSNLASITGISQLFFMVGINLGYVDVEFDSLSGVDLKDREPSDYLNILGLSAGLMKKLYFGRMALSIEAKGGLQSFSLSQKFTYADTEYVYKFNNGWTFGGQGNIGLEFAVSPDVNIGAIAGYRHYPKSDKWTIKLDDDKIRDNEEISGSPEVELSGIAFGLYFHYSPPALPFDPFSFLRSGVGY